MDLKGKKVLITGAANGIGLEIVKELLKNGVQKVAILDVDEKQGNQVVQQLNAQYGQGTTIFIRTDVCDKDKLEGDFQKVVDTFKGLDIVINNAGVADDSRWELEIAINVNAVVRGCILGFKHMGKDSGGNGGVILNLASILGLAPLAGAPIYVATKHAVIGLTRSLALPFHEKRTGVKVLALCPGVTDTPLISCAIQRQLYPDWGVEADREFAELPKQKTEHVAAGAIRALKSGKNGSVWVAEGGKQAYEVNIPHREDIKIPA